MVSSVIICIDKAWTAVDRLSTIWKSDLSDKVELNGEKARWELLHKNVTCFF